MKHIAKIKSTKLGYKPDEVEEIEMFEYCDFDKNDQIDKASKEFNYLLNLPMWSLTSEKVEELQKKIADRQSKMNLINS